MSRALRFIILPVISGVFSVLWVLFNSGSASATSASPRPVQVLNAEASAAMESDIRTTASAALQTVLPATQPLPELDAWLNALAQRVIAEGSNLGAALAANAPRLPELYLDALTVVASELGSIPGRNSSDAKVLSRLALGSDPGSTFGAGSHYGVGVAIAPDASRTVVILATATPMKRLFWIPESTSINTPRSGDSAAFVRPPNSRDTERIAAFLGAVEAEIFAISNVYRVSVGLSALAADIGLDAIARQHSIDMARRGFFSHTNPDGLEPHQRITLTPGWESIAASAENINLYGGARRYLASEPRDLARSMMEGWIHSEGHRLNLVSERVSMLGVGLAYDGRTDSIYGTQKFAANRVP